MRVEKKKPEEPKPPIDGIQSDPYRADRRLRRFSWEGSEQTRRLGPSA